MKRCDSDKPPDSEPLFQAMHDLCNRIEFDPPVDEGWAHTMEGPMTAREAAELAARRLPQSDCDEEC